MTGRTVEVSGEPLIIPLRAERGLFRDGGNAFAMSSRRLQEALRSRLEGSGNRIVHRVEIKGRLYRTSLALSVTEPGVAYAETDRNGVPVDAPAVPMREDALGYIRRVANRCRLTDALTPDTAVLLDTDFVPPRFELLDASEPRELSWDGLADHSRVVILGGPGSGKTSCLRRLAVEAARHTRVPDTIPVFIQLRDFPVENLSVVGIERLLRHDQVPDPGGEFADPLHAGRVLLLLDGLDELPGATDRKRMLDRLQALCARAPHIRVVITSRTPAYDRSLDDFAHLGLRSFDDAQVAQWTFQYFGKQHSTGLWYRFLDELGSNRDLRELTGNPLLLALTASRWSRNPRQVHDRAGLVRGYFDVLVHGWDAVRGVWRWTMSPIAPREILWFLTSLSADLVNERRQEFTVEDIERLTGGQAGVQATPDTLLDTCQSIGLITRTDGSHWMFVHSTFAEYLAASHFVRRTDGSALDVNVVAPGPHTRGVWLMACALASDADQLLRSVLDREQIMGPAAAAWLTEALTQEIMVSREVLDACRDLILRTLENLLSGAVPLPNQADVPLGAGESDEVVWAGGMTAAAEHGHRTADFELAGELVRLVHRARSTAAGGHLPHALHLSKLEALRQVSHAFEYDGRCHTAVDSGVRGTDLHITVTRASE